MTGPASSSRAAGSEPSHLRGLIVAKVLFGFLGFSALVTEIATLVAQHRFRAGDFFSYFTVEANTA